MAPDAAWSGRWGAGSREKDTGPSLGLAGTLPGKGGFPSGPQQVDVGRGWRGVSPGPRAGTGPAPPASHLPGRRVPGRPVKQAAEGCSLQFSKPVPSGDVQERKANFLARRRWGRHTAPRGWRPLDRVRRPKAPTRVKTSACPRGQVQAAEPARSSSGRGPRGGGLPGGPQAAGLGASWCRVRVWTCEGPAGLTAFLTRPGSGR